MSPDAPKPSLSELFRSLRFAPDQKAALVRLAEKVAELDHEREYQQMLFEAEQPPAPPPPPPPRKRTPKDQRWLHVVPGVAAFLAGAAVNWLLRSRWHRAAVTGTAVLALAGGTLAPGVLQPAPAAPVPAYDHDAVAHHHHHATVVIPAAVPVRRKRRRLDSDETVRPSATVTPAASPAPTGAPVPVPSPTVTPDPGPTILPTPVPVPTCTNLTGKHCHPGDLAGDAAGVLRGLTRLS